MADTNWLVSHCESELDWICKIPKGKVVEEPESHEGLSHCTLPCYLLFLAFRSITQYYNRNKLVCEFESK